MVQIRNAVVANVNAVNAVLDDLWKVLTDDVKLVEWGWILNRKDTPVFEKDRHNEGDPEPYRMNLIHLSFKLYDKVRLCDVNGGEKVKCLRPVDTAFKDFSLYPTGSGVQKITGNAEPWGFSGDNGQDRECVSDEGEDRIG